MSSIFILHSYLFYVITIVTSSSNTKSRGIFELFGGHNVLYDKTDGKDV